MVAELLPQLIGHHRADVVINIDRGELAFAEALLQAGIDLLAHVRHLGAGGSTRLEMIQRVRAQTLHPTRCATFSTAMVGAAARSRPQ
ncbi:hypothetical protein G3N88_02180, partial [Xanthomonas hortorum pv. gardneri]|uniref:hypothetical protein n=1 Tax=Xanthomonas hortorum TaxID=56454 RepID=UPI002FE370DF